MGTYVVDFDTDIDGTFTVRVTADNADAARAAVLAEYDYVTITAFLGEPIPAAGWETANPDWVAAARRG